MPSDTMKSPNHIVKKVTSMDNDTRTLFNLTDPHLTFPHHWLKYKTIKKVRVAQISCTLSYIPRACPNCGVINRGQILKYGFYQAKHKYGQFRAQPLMLLVNTQRFQCPDCHTTFNATSYLFEKQRTISRDLRREIILRLTRIQTIKDIAHDLFISEASVQRVLLDLADQYKPNLNYLPETLCIDEFKSMRSAKGKMSFIAVAYLSSLKIGDYVVYLSIINSLHVLPVAE